MQRFMIKKWISILAAVIITAGCFSACGSSGSADAPPAGNNGKLQIVATIFPAYDWVMNILGENPAGAEVTMLLDNGVDLHSFQPTADDILKISTCDLFVYVGGESDAWVDGALKEAINKDMVVVSLLDVLGDAVKEEETIEGMQEEGAEEAQEGSEPEKDEHVWLSLRNAAVLTDAISRELQRMDPENTKLYQKNHDEYLAKLSALDQKYTDTVSDAAVKTLVFGDRFPFRYLTDDYGLSYYAAFAGCSAETEASFETIRFLAEKVDELSLPAVMTIEGTNHTIAETIVQNTKDRNQKILTMDSMQSTTSKDVAAGTTYLSVMDGNLSVLSEALK